jgi:hypothetical protein
MMVAAALATASVAVFGLTGPSVLGVAAFRKGIPSGEFWDANKESDAKSPEFRVFQPNTEDDVLGRVRQARALPQATQQKWKEAGPFGGVQDIPGVGAGDEKFLPIAGIGTAIAADPTDATGNTVYFGTHGGLYKSLDGGKTLKNISDGKLDRAGVGAIGLDPVHPQNIYVGTGVSLLTLSDDQAGTGVYVSHDGGATFSRPDANVHGYGVNAITVLNDGTAFVGTTYGLWRSVDHGASFQKVVLPTNEGHTGPAANLVGSWVTAITIRPGHPKELTVAVGFPLGKKQYSEGTVLAPGNGLYRSEAAGAPGTFSFVAGTSGLTWAGASSDPVGRISLAYASAPGNDSILWALVSDAGYAAGRRFEDIPDLPEGDLNTATTLASAQLRGGSVLNGLYRSADDGATWQLEATPATLAAALGATLSVTYAFPNLYGPGVQAYYNNWVQTDPTNVNRVYIGLEEVYQGDYHDPTGGALPIPTTTWSAIAKYADLCGFFSYLTVPGRNSIACPSVTPVYGTGTTHPDQHGSAIVKTPNGVRLYSGNDGGWFAQDAHAITSGTGFDNASWRSLNGPSTVLPWDVTFLKDGTIAMALQDNGTIHIRKDGTAYNVCGGDGVYVQAGADANSYYCGIPGQLILGTTDDFKHTFFMSPGSPPTPGLTGASFLSPWAVDQSDTNHLIAAAGVVAETTAGPNSDVFDPTNTVLLSSTWKTVFTPPAAKGGQPWDSSAIATKGAVSYVAMCSLCRPSFTLAGGNIVDPTTVNPSIATNVKTGCKAAPASTSCWHLAKSVGLPHQQISGIAVDPKDPRTIYVSLRQYLIISADSRITGAQKVMVSHDAGDTFTDITGNLPRADAHAVVLHAGQLVVANDVGVFTAPATGMHWSRLGTGLPAVPYRSMRMDNTGRYLLAGAYGRGAWVFDFAAAGGAVKGEPKPVVKGTKQTKSPLPATGLATGEWLGLGLLLAALAVGLSSRRLGRRPR